ncbi:MAG TPA: tetratricopeptide repeat protein, partial [Aminobacteriaceae bacterium]|nr:tetratricopeptide repeat protein [Aminobacteriaceae bacterium]
PKDSMKAFYWFDRAARNGYIDAMVNLGVLYEKGDGAVFSPEKAIRWYTEAAEKGSFLGMAYLGEAYYQGRGVRKDEKKAVGLLEQAASSGLPYAQRLLYRIDRIKYMRYRDVQ